MASTSLPPAGAFYVPSLPTLEGPLNAHPTHPLNIWAGLLPSGDPKADADGKDAGQKDDKILYVSSTALVDLLQCRIGYALNGRAGPVASSGSRARWPAGSCGKPLRIWPLGALRRRAVA